MEENKREKRGEVWRQVCGSAMHLVARYMQRANCPHIRARHIPSLWLLCPSTVRPSWRRPYSRDGLRYQSGHPTPPLGS